MAARRHVVGMICLLCACMVSQPGCWGRKFFRMPRETMETSAKADSLIQENAELRQRIARIERGLEEQQDYSRRSNAQLKIDLEELKDQLNVVQEMLRNAGQDSYYRPRVGVEGEGPEQRGGETAREDVPIDEGQADASGDSVSVEPEGMAGSSADTVRAEAPESVPAAEEIYRQVYLDYSRGEYQLAVEESELFLEKYEEHPLSQEILFIRGECFMEQDKYFDALKEFSRILQEFPSGKRIPAALLRMAISYESIGETEVAAGIVRRLLREHPYSEEAALAEERYGGLLEE
jgi:TolA-binding protein